MTEILLITPAFIQLNTPYPATAYLKGFLNSKSIHSFQMDLGLEVILNLFSKNGLQKTFDFVDKQGKVLVGKNAQKFGLTIVKKEVSFANNDIEFVDTTGIDHTKFSFGLKKSLSNFMHGTGFEIPVQKWFDFKVPKTTVNTDYISKCGENADRLSAKPTVNIIWIGD